MSAYLPTSQKGGEVYQEPVTGTALASPYFLLSYPHTPYHGIGDGHAGEPDFWVEKFFKDLCRALEALGVPELPKLGVFDRDLWVLDDWRTGLPEALAACRVLVPLCAPRYFQSLACGKEWAAFATRSARNGGPDGRPPIVPVTWAPMKPHQLPGAARSIPVEHWGLASYEKFGLESIIMRNRHRADYRKVIRQLARRVKAMAESAIPACGPVDFENLPSPFASGPGPMPGDHPLRITVAAPCLGHLPASRGRFYYGPSAREWNPYLAAPGAEQHGATAEPPEPIADFFFNLARSQDFRPYVGELREHAPSLVNGAPPAAPELLIVDPWALTQPECADLLIRCNLPVKPWVQVVIPWNRDDRELAAQEGMLRQVLDNVLGPKLEQVRVTAKLAADGVPALDDLRLILPDLMQAAMKNYFRYAEVPLSDELPAERPLLPVFGPD